MLHTFKRTLTLVLALFISVAPALTTSVPTVHAASAMCDPGEAQLNFTNNSGISNGDIYGTVTMASGTVTPAEVVNQSPSVSLAGNFPTDPSDPTGNTFYVCLESGVSSGVLWISLKEPIVGLPDTQPTVTSDFRFGTIEFSYPGQADYTNINSFDFPINLRTYTTPGDSSPAEEELFTGNTCQVYNALRTTVADAGDEANWEDMLVTNADGFVRVISPSNGLPNYSGWPDLTAYIDAVIENAPDGEIIVQDYYVGSSVDPENVGWFKYTGTFDGDGTLTLDGTIAATAVLPTVTGGSAGSTITVTKENLALGIYQQSDQYDVDGSPGNSNDVYARIWNDLTTSFNYGYWGSGYGTGFDTKDFFETFTGTGTTSPSGGQPAFKPARTIDYPPTLPAGGFSYNLYASVISQYTTSYAFPYNENFGSGGRGTSPLLDIPDGGLIAAELPSDGWSNGVSGSTTCGGSVNPTNNSGSGSPGGGPASTPFCSAMMPFGSPNLFQVNVNNTQATLYFVPVLGANNYYVGYGNGQNVEQYGVEFEYPNATGVIAYTINDLAPNTSYSFIVRAGNSCMPGAWGNAMQATTTGSAASNKIFYQTF